MAPFGWVQHIATFERSLLCEAFLVVGRTAFCSAPQRCVRFRILRLVSTARRTAASYSCRSTLRSELWTVIYPAS